MENSSFDDIEQPNTNSHWALYIAIGAFALGAIGTAVGVVARTQAQSTTLRVENIINDVNKTVDNRLAEMAPSTNDQELIRALEGKLETLETQNRATIEALKTKCETLEKAIQSMNANRRGGNANTTNTNNKPIAIDPAAPGDTKEYVIQPGDNFYKIAKTVGCTAKEIQNLNPDIDPAKLRVGKKIFVPAK